MSQAIPIFNGGESAHAEQLRVETTSVQPATGAAQSDGGTAPTPSSESAAQPSANAAPANDASSLAEGSGIMKPRS